MSAVNAQVEALERLYGNPLVERARWRLDPSPWDDLRRAAARGRHHDITLFIVRDDAMAVIRKHTYPPGVFRPPSGGVEAGETVEEGAAREAYEETGLSVVLRRYLLRAEVLFRSVEAATVTIPWTTHVFLAEWRLGEPRPVDVEEIAEARWASILELRTVLQERLDRSPSHGLRYRGWLQRVALATLRAGEIGR
jgi:ADP-ribose pyrophosphatase YjhB (NUDIX family)